MNKEETAKAYLSLARKRIASRLMTRNIDEKDKEWNINITICGSNQIWQGAFRLFRGLTFLDSPLIFYSVTVAIIIVCLCHYR